MIKYFWIFLPIILYCRELEEEKLAQIKTNTKKNLLIVSITNYDWDKVAIFFNSYVQANFENTDFVVYVHNVTNEFVNKIASYGTIVIPFPDEFKKVSVYFSRWKLASNYLKQNPDKYKLVLTLDTRDSFFQKDPFKYYENINKSFIGLALEDGFLSQEETNGRWLISAFGESYYKTLTTERIICMGTVWGTPDKFIQFADKMYEILTSEISIKKDYIDQAVANYLFYHDKMFNDCIITSDNRDGPIMNYSLKK